MVARFYKFTLKHLEFHHSYDFLGDFLGKLVKKKSFHTQQYYTVAPNNKNTIFIYKFILKNNNTKNIYINFDKLVKHFELFLYLLNVYRSPILNFKYLIFI